MLYKTWNALKEQYKVQQPSEAAELTYIIQQED
jgi:hypothetical protein